MNKEAENPDTNGTATEVIKLTERKNTIFSDNPIRQRLYELFLSGGRYSVVQLSALLRIPDPRSHIRYIRNAGIQISNYWIKTDFSRYKVYFLADSGKVQ